MHRLSEHNGGSPVWKEVISGATLMEACGKANIEIEELPPVPTIVDDSDDEVVEGESQVLEKTTIITSDDLAGSSKVSYEDMIKDGEHVVEDEGHESRRSPDTATQDAQFSRKMFVMPNEYPVMIPFFN